MAQGMGPRERQALLACLENPIAFAAAGGIRLRAYQQAVARAVIDSIENRWGLSLVVLFPRQSGKNELQAQIEAYLLTRYSRVGGEMVKISPTWKPQSINAMSRLERVLENHLLLKDRWKKENGYRYKVGLARQTFLSGSPEANIVGATASLLLQVDEAQDIRPEKYDKEIAPMAASTNATRIFWGTAWTDETLLARELEAARRLEKQDRRRRAFVVDADRVAREVPAYGAFVAGQVARLGRDHPMVRTQFFCETLSHNGGLFNEVRLALMAGSHSSLSRPLPGEVYAVLLDVAGEDNGLTSGKLDNPTRDRTALTVVRIRRGDGQPVYEAVFRKNWLGVKHSELLPQVLALVKLWSAVQVVVDATGVGAGLASFLSAALPGRVVSFLFSAASKSKLGWDFLALIDSGRYREHADPTPQQGQFYAEAAVCEYAVSPGPERRLSWSVPQGKRDANGQIIHDDWLLSAALCARLADLPLGLPGRMQVVAMPDPLEAMDRVW